MMTSCPVEPPGVSVVAQQRYGPGMGVGIVSTVLSLVGVAVNHALQSHSLSSYLILSHARFCLLQL